jgi:hypothetical protein
VEEPYVSYDGSYEEFEKIDGIGETPIKYITEM